MAIGAAFFVSYYADLIDRGARRRAEYVFNTDPHQIDNSSYYAARQAVLTYGEYFILINTIIPISLIVSLEFVKLIQTPFINNDVEMYDPESMKLAQPISMTLHEELASVNYIFADKTGTLTANVMKFKACSVASICYDDDYKLNQSKDRV